MKRDMNRNRNEKDIRKAVGCAEGSPAVCEGKDLKGMKMLLAEEDGMGTVEIILIVVVLVGLVIIFKDQITKIVDNLFDKISTQTGRI